MKVFKLLIVILFLSIGFIIGLYVGIFHKLPFANNPNDFGNYGSFLGGITGVIATIISICALNHASKAFKGQNKQFERQSFENGFFNLLTLFTERVNALEMNNKKGSAVFDVILEEFKTYSNQVNINRFKTIELVDKSYKNEFSVLLLHFKSIAGYIDRRDEDKEYYFSIFYSVLTVTEVDLLNRIAKLDDNIRDILEKHPNILLPDPQYKVKAEKELSTKTEGHLTSNV